MSSKIVINTDKKGCLKQAKCVNAYDVVVTSFQINFSAYIVEVSRWENLYDHNVGMRCGNIWD
jgi:hypothetical protein